MTATDHSRPTVIVLGLGAMGSATAAALAKRGARVIGIERFGPVHALGSSHGGSRIIRQSYFEDPAYVPLLLRAYELWDELETGSELPIRTLTGGLYAGDPDSVTVAGSIEAAQQWGLTHEVLDASAISRRFPHFSPAPHEIGLFEQAAGFVRPENTIRAQLDLAARCGADLRFHTEVLDIESDASGVRARTSEGIVSGDRIVVCPGAWAPALLSELGVPMRVERQVMYWMQTGGQYENFAAGPVYVHERSDAQQIYGFPAIDGPGGGAKVAFFRKGIDCNPDTVDREISSAEAAAMRERLSLTLPALSAEADQPPLDAKACLYTTTPDEHFVLGAHPHRENVVVACGFSGHGFKFTPVVGQALSELALDGYTGLDIALFDPQRFAAIAPT